MGTLTEFEISHLYFEKIPYLLSPTSICVEIFVFKITTKFICFLQFFYMIKTMPKE